MSAEARKRGSADGKAKTSDLPIFRSSALRHGYTTGACAAAAAKGAALILREQRPVDEVEIILPMGEKARFRLHGREFTENFAACYVVKDAGDDPDVTHGAEIHARVTLAEIPPSPRPSPTGGEGEGESHIIIEGGAGIGRVTKPGLAVPVGEWAINPVPRRMIEEAVREVFPVHGSRLRAEAPVRRTTLAGGLQRAGTFTVHCLISIPNGEELAKKTLNTRLGIVGGLSILGTTGIVRPISAKAWTDTIDAAIDVALACGCGTVVLSTGRTSELVAQKFLRNFPPPLMGLRAEGRFCPQAGGGEGEGEMSGITPTLTLPPQGGGNDFVRPKEEAFVMMGDHVGYALRACARKGVREVVIAGQFAKLLKIACGHEQTHVTSSELDLRMLAGWLNLEPRTSNLEPLAKRANTARQVLEASGNDPALIGLVCGKVKEFAPKLAPGVEIKVLLAGYGGEVLYFG